MNTKKVIYDTHANTVANKAKWEAGMEVDLTDKALPIPADKVGTADSVDKGKVPTVNADGSYGLETKFSGSYTDLANKPTIPDVDNNYSPSSENAQSGIAVAQALAGVPSGITEISTQDVKIWQLDSGVYKLTYNGDKHLYFGTTQYKTVETGAYPVAITITKGPTNYWSFWYLYMEGVTSSPLMCSGYTYYASLTGKYSGETYTKRIGTIITGADKASTSKLGIVQLDGTTIRDKGFGVIEVVPATGTSLGTVKVDGYSLSINNNGYLEVNIHQAFVNESTNVFSDIYEMWMYSFSDLVQVYFKDLGSGIDDMYSATFNFYDLYYSAQYLGETGQVIVPFHSIVSGGDASLQNKDHGWLTLAIDANSGITVHKLDYSNGETSTMAGSFSFVMVVNDTAQA